LKPTVSKAVLKEFASFSGLHEKDAQTEIEQWGEVEDQEIDDNTEGTLICLPASMIENTIPGSVKGMCGKCGTDIWISPATQESIPITVKRRCIHCVGGHLK
jgi:hypothetical protein